VSLRHSTQQGLPADNSSNDIMQTPCVSLNWGLLPSMCRMSLLISVAKYIYATPNRCVRLVRAPVDKATRPCMLTWHQLCCLGLTPQQCTNTTLNNRCQTADKKQPKHQQYSAQHGQQTNVESIYIPHMQQQTTPRALPLYCGMLKPHPDQPHATC